MPKLLFTASSFVHILHFHLPYLRAFAERGWTVHVACGGEAADLPCAARVISLPLEKSIRSPRNFQAARLLRRLIRAEGYDLICTHTMLAAFFTRLALVGLRRRPKLVNMVHGYLFDDESPRARRLLLLTAERLTAGQTDLLLTMTAYDYALATREKLCRRVEQIPGVGVDFSRFDGAAPLDRHALGLAEDSFVLLYAAEFSQRKSQEHLIRAMAELPERVTLVLAGNGSELARCQALARELGVAERLRFPGYVKDLAPWYATADAAVSASRSEGLPFNVMEAMYMGLPIVATRVKGHVDLLRDGESGLLVPYGDVSAFASSIRKLLDEPALRQRLGAQARAEVSRYALERVFPQVWAAYQSVLEERT